MPTSALWCLSASVSYRWLYAATINTMFEAHSTMTIPECTPRGCPDHPETPTIPNHAFNTSSHAVSWSERADRGRMRVDARYASTHAKLKCGITGWVMISDVKVSGVRCQVFAGVVSGVRCQMSGLRSQGSVKTLLTSLGPLRLPGGNERGPHHFHFHRHLVSCQHWWT